MSTRIEIPPGQATGCNERHHPFATRCPAFGEVFNAIPSDNWPELLKVHHSLRPFVNVILSQGSVGSCATESTTQADHIARSTQGLPFVFLNPWSIYCFTGGTKNGGSSIDDNLEHARDVGILPESVWPRSNGYSRKPPQSMLDEHASQFRIEEFFDIENVEQIGTALLLGFPVVFGWSGHSVVFTDLLDVNTAEYCNSWAESWGDHGFGKLALRSVNFSYGAFALRVASESKTDPTPPVISV